MTDILMSETRWAHKKWNKIASDIKLVFYSSANTITHGPINIRLSGYFNILRMEEFSHWTEYCKIQEATVGWGGGDEKCVQNIGGETSRKTSVLGFGISDIELLNSAATILNSGQSVLFYYVAGQGILSCREPGSVKTFCASCHTLSQGSLWIKKSARKSCDNLQIMPIMADNCFTM